MLKENKKYGEEHNGAAHVPPVPTAFSTSKRRFGTGSPSYSVAPMAPSKLGPTTAWCVPQSEGPAHSHDQSDALYRVWCKSGGVEQPLLKYEPVEV